MRTSSDSIARHFANDIITDISSVLCRHTVLGNRCILDGVRELAVPTTAAVKTAQIPLYNRPTHSGTTGVSTCKRMRYLVRSTFSCVHEYYARLHTFLMRI